MDKTGKIDDIDRKILSILMENSNTSYSVIAKQLFVSSGTVHVRMTKLKEMGIDYDLLSRKLKAGELLQHFPITGFAYSKEGTLEPELFKEFEKRVLEAYEKVLESNPQKCPVELFIKYIVGPTAVREYHLFKDEGFDVPFSGQKAFFTMMMEFRSPPVEGE